MKPRIAFEWSAGPAVCAACHGFHPGGLPEIRLSLHRITLCPPCRGRLQVALLAHDGEQASQEDQ